MAEDGAVDYWSASSKESVTNTEIDLTAGTALAEDLLARCQTLLNELQDFTRFVTEQQSVQEPAVDIRKFQSSVRTEHRSLQKVSFRRRVFFL